jgi:hypothetical protein
LNISSVSQNNNNNSNNHATHAILFAAIAMFGVGYSSLLGWKWQVSPELSLIGFFRKYSNCHFQSTTATPTQRTDHVAAIEQTR